MLPDPALQMPLGSDYPVIFSPPDLTGYSIFKTLINS